MYMILNYAKDKLSAHVAQSTLVTQKHLGRNI